MLARVPFVSYRTLLFADWSICGQTISTHS